MFIGNVARRGKRRKVCVEIDLRDIATIEQVIREKEAPMNHEALKIIKDPRFQKKAREVMGDIRYLDVLHHQYGKGRVVKIIDGMFRVLHEDGRTYLLTTKSYVRIPPPISIHNDGRDLVSCCKGFVTLGKALFKKDSWFVTVRNEIDGIYQGFESYKADTPTLALLRTIKAQMERE